MIIPYEDRQAQYANPSARNSGPGDYSSAAAFKRNISPPHVVLQETKYSVSDRQPP